MPNHRLRNCEFDVESVEHSRNSSSKRSHGENSHSTERHRRRYHRDSRSRSRSRSSSRGRNHSSRRDRHRTSKHRRESSRSRSKSSSGRHSHSHSHKRNRDTRDTREHKDHHKRRERDDKHSRRSNSSSRQSSECNASKSGPSTNSPLPNSYMNEECTAKKDATDLKELPLPDNTLDSVKEPQAAYYNFDINEPIDKERIHREVEEKLRQALAKEGKVYPPPKPEASHPVFANDGSFLEIFKKMQEQQQQQQAANRANNPVVQAVPVLASANTAAVPYLTAAAMGKSAPPPPIVGRRKGGKILKTGLVAKPKVNNEASNDPKDFWSLYLAEVNKYKNTACESETGNRPLVK